MLRCLFHRSYYNFCICVLVVLFYQGGKACVVSIVHRCLDLLDFKGGLISELHQITLLIDQIFFFSIAPVVHLISLANLFWVYDVILKEPQQNWSCSWLFWSICFWGSRPQYFYLCILKNVSSAEHTVCVRMCAYMRPRDWAVRSFSRYIQHLCGDGVSPLPHRPPPTPSDKVWLKGHAWLCRYLHQHVGVMVSFLRFLFFCIVVCAGQ